MSQNQPQPSPSNPESGWISHRVDKIEDMEKWLNHIYDTYEYIDHVNLTPDLCRCILWVNYPKS